MISVKVNNAPLERVIKHKSLGVQIDESLNWRPHINTISKKISAGIAILKCVSHFIPFDTRVNMYNALAMPYFNYCGAVWGNINKGIADKLQKMQNRAARIITFSNYEVRSSFLLNELGWERLEHVRLKQLAVTMIKSFRRYEVRRKLFSSGREKNKGKKYIYIYRERYINIGSRKKTTLSSRQACLVDGYEYSYH